MAPESTQAQKFSLFALTALVVGSMIGAGIFSLPCTFASATQPLGAIIAWGIAGAGMYTLARVRRGLSASQISTPASTPMRGPGSATIPASCRPSSPAATRHVVTT